MPDTNAGFLKIIELIEMMQIIAGTPDDEKKAKFIEMLKLFQEISAQIQIDDSLSVPQNKLYCAGFDAEKLEERLRTPELLTIKTAIPFLEQKYQQNMLILVKMIELRRILEFCREAAEAVQLGNMNIDEWRAQVFSAFCSNLNPIRQRYMELFIKFLEIDGIIKKIKEYSNE